MYLEFSRKRDRDVSSMVRRKIGQIICEDNKMARRKPVVNKSIALNMLIEVDAMASRLSCLDRTTTLEKEVLEDSLARSIGCLSNILARTNNFDGYDYLLTRKKVDAPRRI